ncbi:hypothetical protein EB118_06510 [bacterium]|nr:hypothetical protein [bacterium]
MKTRPQYTIESISAQIWPLDAWSREIIIRTLKEDNLPYDDTIPTTMGTSAIRLRSNKDYQRVIKLLENYQ